MHQTTNKPPVSALVASKRIVAVPVDLQQLGKEPCDCILGTIPTTVVTITLGSFRFVFVDLLIAPERQGAIQALPCQKIRPILFHEIVLMALWAVPVAKTIGTHDEAESSKNEKILRLQQPSNGGDNEQRQIKHQSTRTVFFPLVCKGHHSRISIVNLSLN